ncbi:ABC transporter substrate-binding protein [Occultella gossypii]|uniref:Carbohydrate ABC transporter substrate-binding protein n=1 Tax=Occultella gossypii TaxID=2800820 RepID=A0ABS7S9S3_9MICO|nr:ABC transporter substrate-binding protein [Occultella gossypii]MBZ2196046.1 carbohydrate ABC transporter substrate-binding protein [Occultella gossypii]
MSRRSRSRGLFPVVALALAGTLVACGSSTGPGSDPDGSGDGEIGGELTLATSPEQNRGLELFYDQFEEETGATIDAEFQQVDSLNEQLRIQITSGTAPDMFRSAPGSSVPSAVLSLAGEGNVMDLSDQPWVEQVPDSFLPLMSNDDGLFAYPMSGQGLLMFYNRSVFEEVGVEVPTTWTEFLDVCEQIKAAGTTPIALGLGTPAYIQFIPYMLSASLVANLDPDFIEQRAAGETTFAESEGWHETWEKFLSLIELGYTTDQPLGVASDQTIQQVGTGDAAMIALTSGSAAVLADYAPGGLDDIGIFALPATDDPAETWTPFSPDYLVVNANAENAPTALAFLEYLSDPARAAQYAEETAMVPALANADPVDNDLNDVLQVFRDEDRTTPFANHLWPNGEVQQVLMATGQQVVEGTKTIDELLAEMDAAFGDGA